MRKIIKFLISMCVLSLMLVFNVYAEEELKINNWDIKSNVLENGDLVINEDISFRFSDKFNGVFRDIKIKNTSKVSDMKIYEKVNGKEIEFKQVEKGSNGDNGVYEIKYPSKDYASIKIFSPSKNQVKTFTLKYKILNESIKYKDTGELFYKFIGEENKTPIDKLNININLPKPALKDKVKIFAHGPLNGQINFSEKGAINLQVDNVNSEKFVAARILFPVEYINKSTNIVEENAYSRIMNEELSYASSVKKKIENSKKRMNAANYGSFAFIGISILITFVLGIKFRRKQKINIENTYGMIPEDCTPAVASVVYSYYLGSKDIIATILDLSRKGYLNLEEVEESEKLITQKESKVKKQKKDKDYKIINNEYIEDNLLEHEKFFIDWLINKIGNGSFVTLDIIREYSKKNTGKFTGDYKKWEELVRKYVKENKYYDNKAKQTGILLILFSFFQVLLGILFIALGSNYGIAVLIIGIVFIIWSIALMYRKSDYGYVQYKKWAKFREEIKKVKEYNIQKKFSENYIDECLIYGMSLGLSQKEINKFKPYIMSSSVYSNSYLYWYFLNSDSKNNSFNKSIDSAFNSAVPSTGSGGGFSGGGASGAGGGGGAGGF
ncbi:DUF2207 domain-containing protein [Clostridium sp. MB40-C1]|uniref:DUF2207 domain-containing protein n=1 Tax=Clostridium sp. MB40-C1 TaxID=3070996 RepID=UPI0027DFF1B0|nr:DUF2207 domain-containing protein [Clostridium sp. MB40-C1]WMJ79131.1 DUF2207 domain-containing protein [Clostridium sp. MB40-C1]